MRHQRISVYTGPGSSNSWVWLADFLERFGFLNTRFSPDPSDFLGSADRSIVVIPGGDTFEIARAFGEDALRILHGKITDGATYVGICAGAYLPLRSSMSPLSAFNLVSLKIANLSSSLPLGLEDAERYTVPYGCRYVFHPARGPVGLMGEERLVAPIYGGPIIKTGDTAAKYRLCFDGLVQETECLVQRELCESIFRGTAACIEAEHGSGRLLLVSPHLEHPDFSAANDYLARVISQYRCSQRIHTNDSEDSQDESDLRRVIADLRVAASGLESKSWKIGIKYWESEKLMFFIEAVRKRLDVMRKRGDVACPPATIESFKAALKGLKELNGPEKEIKKIVSDLSNGASIFLNEYFSRRILAE